MESSIAAAAGTIIEGSLAARAAEPAAGEGADGHFHERACLNCGTALIGRHCHQCGQSAHVHRTLAALFHDLLHGMIHFEGKVWRTIPLLAWNPGKLTREYIDGRRASYVSPVALFLFCVFLTFAVVHLVHGTTSMFGSNSSHSSEKKEKSEKAPEKVLSAAELDRAIAEARTQRARATTDDQREALDDHIEELTDAKDELKQATEKVTAAGQKAPDIKVNIVGNRDLSVTLSKRLEEAWKKSKANPELTAFKMEENAHKYSWVLVPLSVPFVWLMFPFYRRYKVYDHTVFVTYSLCFMMLLQSGIVVASHFSLNWLVGLLSLYIPVHMYRHIRGTYGTGKWTTVLRTMWLLWSALFALLFWVITLMALLLTE